MPVSDWLMHNIISLFNGDLIHTILGLADNDMAHLKSPQFCTTGH